MEGAVQALGAGFQAVEADHRALARAPVPVDDLQVPDVHLVDHRQGGRLAALRGGLSGVLFGSREFPVAAALGVGLDQRVEADQDDAGDAHIAGEQRQEFHLRLQAPEGDHFGARAPGRVGEGDAFHGDGGSERDIQAQVAGDGQVAAGGGLHLFRDQAAVLVEIHGLEHDDAGHHHGDQEDRDHGEDLPRAFHPWASTTVSIARARSAKSPTTARAPAERNSSASW